MEVLLNKIIERATKGGYPRSNFKIDAKKITDWYPVIFSHEFAKAFWGEEPFPIGNGITPEYKEYLHHLQCMAYHENPFDYLARFFIEVGTESFDEFVFGKDLFMDTGHPFATDSKDDWSPKEFSRLFHYKPISLVADFWTGNEMARALLERWPDKTKLLDLGTATGSVPLSMREEGMLAVGVDGLNVESYQIKPYMLKTPDLFAWDVARNIVENCDITMPFKITDENGDTVKFDYIISTDCFEHLVTERIPTALYNIKEHLCDDGFGIIEIHTKQFYGIHQTCEDYGWWREMFESNGLVLCEGLMRMDFPYIRIQRKNGILYHRNHSEPTREKLMFWVRKS